MSYRIPLLTRADRDRLHQFVAAHERRLAREQALLERLTARIDTARVVDAEDLPSDSVTLHSQVRLRDMDSGRSFIATMALPLEPQVEPEGPLARGYPIAALVGAREGEIVVSPLSRGHQRARVEEVVFQPRGMPIPSHHLVSEARANG